MAVTEQLARADARPVARTPALSLVAVDVLVFLGALAVATAVGAVLAYGFDLWYNDASIRTADAYMVLYSRDPHAGAIGFVWPPLPTALRVLLLPITRPLGLGEFTGPLVGIACTAGVAVVLNWILRDLHIAGWARALWITLTFANPIVLLHFTNGTAESTATLFVLLTIYFYRHLDERPVTSVLGMGIACALALWTRYEAIGLVAAAVGALVLRSFNDTRGEAPKEWAYRLEAQLTALLAPVAFAGMLWLFANWAIQGDALFFYNSVYSVGGEAAVARNRVDHPLAYAYGHVLGAFRYLGLRLVQASFVFPLAGVGVALVALARKDQRAVAVLLLAGSALAVQTYQAYTGAIPAWLRYWVYVPALAVVLLGYASNGVREVGRWRLPVAVARYAVAPALLIAANLMGLNALAGPELEPYERVFAQLLLRREVSAADAAGAGFEREPLRAAAAHLRGTRGAILLDLTHSAPFVLAIDDPARLVTNPDREFSALLSQPFPSVRWLLVPSSEGQTEQVLQRAAITQRYPGIYEGAPWLRLEREFVGLRGWRLFEVIGNPPRE